MFRATSCRSALAYLDSKSITSLICCIYQCSRCSDILMSFTVLARYFDSKLSLMSLKYSLGWVGVDLVFELLSVFFFLFLDNYQVLRLRGIAIRPNSHVSPGVFATISSKTTADFPLDLRKRSVLSHFLI
jgi:hypothetical protein